MINIAQAIALVCLVFSFHASFATSHEGDMEPEGATDHTHTTPSHTSSMMTSHHNDEEEDEHTTSTEHSHPVSEPDEMDNNTDVHHEDHTDLHHENHTTHTHHDDHTEHPDDHHVMTPSHVGNTTVRSEHTMTTPMAKQEDHTEAKDQLICHLCEGDECRNPSKTCVSETGACWVMYLMESMKILRGCVPRDPDTICTDTDQLPFGGHFNAMVCEWCCQGDLCREENSMSLGALCNDLLVQSSAANSLSLLTKWVTLATIAFITTKDIY